MRVKSLKQKARPVQIRPTFYEQQLYSDYVSGKHHPIPVSKINPIRDRVFLSGLSDTEAGCLASLVAGSDVKHSIRVLQRARLIARKLGIRNRDIHFFHETR